MPTPHALPSANAWQGVSAYNKDAFVSFFRWQTLINAKLLDCLMHHIKYMQY
jgi:hypothetical protein